MPVGLSVSGLIFNGAVETRDGLSDSRSGASACRILGGCEWPKTVTIFAGSAPGV
jgi:hypothetical protein